MTCAMICFIGLWNLNKELTDFFDFFLQSLFRDSYLHQLFFNLAFLLVSFTSHRKMGLISDTPSVLFTFAKKKKWKKKNCCTTILTNVDSKSTTRCFLIPPLEGSPCRMLYEIFWVSKSNPISPKVADH